MQYVDRKSSARWDTNNGKVYVSADNGQHWGQSTMTLADIEYMVKNKLVDVVAR